MSATQLASPPRVIAVSGTKGGIGKSTVAVFLAAEALARGRKVLLVDADPQATTRTWGDEAAEAGRPTPTITAMGPAMHRPGQLDTVGAAYDLVVIDCPGRDAAVQRSALLAADLALLPCGPSGVEAWAMAATVKLVTEAQEFRPALAAAILVTRKKANTTLGREIRRTMESTGFPLLETELGDREAYRGALMSGLSLADYAPHDPAAREVRRLADELLGKERVRRVG
jgi:chromosome partitioning protein